MIYTINRQLGASCLNKVLIEFMRMSKPNMSLYAHFVYASFSIGNDTNSSSTVERNKSNTATTRPNQWVILTVPNIIQIDSLKRITRILSGRSWYIENFNYFVLSSSTIYCNITRCRQSIVIARIGLHDELRLDAWWNDERWWLGNICSFGAAFPQDTGSLTKYFNNLKNN